MLEQAFWRHLESRASIEMAGLVDKSFHGLACNGFVPQRLGLVGDRPAVIGTVSMLAENQETWHFALLLPDQVQNFNEINWQQLLPAADDTGWLSLNRLKKEMKIDPGAAYPDLKAR